MHSFPHFPLSFCPLRPGFIHKEQSAIESRLPPEPGDEPAAIVVEYQDNTYQKTEEWGTNRHSVYRAFFSDRSTRFLQSANSGYRQAGCASLLPCRTNQLYMICRHWRNGKQVHDSRQHERGAAEKCCSGAAVPSYQASLVRIPITLAPFLTNLRK